MEKEITITVKYTFKEFILPVKQKIFKSWGTWIVILMASGMVVFNIIYIFDKSILEKEIPIINIIFPAIVFLIFPLAFYFILKKSFNKNYLLREETTATYNKKGMASRSKSVQTFTEWDKIKKIKEHKKYFVLSNISGLDSYLNKSFFTDEELNDFKLLIKDLNF
ncbi:MAG: YcxB family protein [Polaribacter sp.]